jgi:1-acyl-sn-glycerol-3-phosphate acyltransferase
MVGALLDVATLPLLQQERVKILTILKSPKTLNENEKKSWLRPVVPFGDILDLTGFLYVPHGGGFCEALRLCREAFRDGYHVLTYPEGKHCGTKRWPREWRSIPRVQHGCFEIARQTQTPIVPILIGGDRDHFGWCNPGPLDILYLREFNPRDYSSTATLAEAIRTEMNVGLARLAAHRSRE